MCYSLILFLSELNGKNLLFGDSTYGIVHVFHYKTKKKKKKSCDVIGSIGVFIFVFHANCRLVVELELMKAPMLLWLRVAQGLLNVKMLIIFVRK